MSPEEIKLKIKNAPSLDFGEIFNASIELFKKSIVHGFVMQILILLISAPFIIMLYVPIVMNAFAQSQYDGMYSIEDNSELMVFSWGVIVLFFLAIILIGTLSHAINAAFIRMLHKLDIGLEVKTKDLFYFFKSSYLLKMLLLIIVTIIIAIVAMTLFVIPLIYAIVPLQLILYVFAFNPDFSVGEIVDISFRLGTKKWLITFGLLIISGILASIIGFLLCGIGTLFTAPFVYHPLYFIYKRVVGIGEFKSSLKV